MVRKGKSQRRVKDWDRRFRQSQDPSTMDAAESETLQPERVKLPSERMQDRPQQPDLAARPKAEGMVVGLFPGGVYVRTGGIDLLCGIAGTFRAPEGASALAVGDEVAVALAPAPQSAGNVQGDMQRTDGFILSRQLRRTVLSRPEPASGKHRGLHGQYAFEKVIAANMEVLLIVASTRQPRLSPALIDRYLIVAERGELRPIVAINKIDLAEPDEELMQQLTARNVAAHACSCLTGAGLTDLLAALTGRRSVLAGASGVGKSTLVNALVPGANVATSPVRRKDNRGRHVTAAAKLHELPGGGVIVDTPGVRELALEMDAAELPWYFPEFAALTGRCRFNNCTHTHEPDCAVIAAVGAGTIPAYRYDGYLRILQTL